MTTVIFKHALDQTCVDVYLKMQPLPQPAF